jgi:hypothetical protein
MKKEAFYTCFVVLMILLSSCVATQTPVKESKMAELKVEVCAEHPVEAKPESVPPSAPAEEVISYAAEPAAPKSADPETAVPVEPVPESAGPPVEEEKLAEEAPAAESAQPYASEAVPAARIDALAAANGNKGLMRRVFYGTDRKASGMTERGMSYGNERGELQLGFCEVSIPPDHKMGELESPKWWKLEFSENPNKHVVLLNVQELSKGNFFTELRFHIDKASDKEAFVLLSINFLFFMLVFQTA